MRCLPPWLRCFIAASLLLSLAVAPVDAQDKPNVLFICIDDLRPELGAYGEKHMKTPHLDKLAAEGRLFMHQYVAAPSCGPSRWCMLTGRAASRLPDFGMSKCYAQSRGEPADQPRSMPEAFRRAGYRTVGIGKISHNPDGFDHGASWKGQGPLAGTGVMELPDAWDEMGVPSGKWKHGWGAFFAYADGSSRQLNGSPNHEAADVDDRGYPDGLIADAAVEKLRHLAGKEQPFFLAVGFFKPHLPFNAPRRYFDLYDPAGLPAVPLPTAPRGVDPSITLHKSEELTPRYTGLRQVGKVEADEAARLRHAYFACVSYTDAQVGKVLRTLDELKLREKTIVVVWGDHGYHLGDNSIWCKATLHERSLRSAFLMRMPEMPHPGQPTRGIVSAIDIYPTLAELCGVDVSGVKNIDGRSFSDLLWDPQHPARFAAASMYNHGPHVGSTIRTAQHRLTVWTHQKTGQTTQVELYDHLADPQESVNIAAENPQIVTELRPALQSSLPR